MNNVIDFPDKVFLQWGAVAQVLTPYLKYLGATKEEGNEIISWLKAKWEYLGVPLALPGLRLILGPPSDEKDNITKAVLTNRAMHTGRHLKSENARTLLELAKLEYQLSKAS